MPHRPFTRIILLAAAAAALGACSTHSDAFGRHEEFMARQRADAAAADRKICPVVVSNATDQQLAASYRLEGHESILGMIPAGRSLSFVVFCNARRIEALATATHGGLLGGADEYRAVAALDRTQATRVAITVRDRVR